MKCNKCQAELPEESKFCLKCGEKVDSMGLITNKFNRVVDKLDKEYDKLEKQLKKKITDKIKIKILEKQKLLIKSKNNAIYKFIEEGLNEISNIHRKVNELSS